jgi:hypothetical protein
MKLFLEAGTDVNLRNKNGTTPLNFAVDHGTDHMVRMLLDAGADMNAEDERCESGKVNRTAIRNIVSRGKTNIVKMLLDAGAHLVSCLLSAAICHAYYGEHTYCPASYRKSVDLIMKGMVQGGNTVTLYKCYLTLGRF